ncbi:MAG: S-layer homology domain-containing protein [Eubacteriales bacterium]|nr:S-layer homology domain-containing protein [Eubacteriales bacterium]
MKRKVFKLIIVFCLVFFIFPQAVAKALTMPPNLEAPQNLTVELKEWEDGRPYFALKWTNPKSIWELEQYGVKNGVWGAEYQIDMKIGKGQWLYDIGGSLFGNGINFDEESDDPENYVTDDTTCDPLDLGVEGTVDIKSNAYHLRVRYAYLVNQNSGNDDEYYIYGPFSNVASIGVDDFYKDAHEWAKPELQEAYDADLIPDILIGKDMTKPITREEFCELALRLYEKAAGKTAVPVSPNPFTDTNNPQILKAFALGITKGTSADKFTPNKTITRQECATMLFRTIKAIEPNGDFSIAGVPDFPDQKHIDSWAVEGTKYMSKVGIIKGNASGYFMPKATTTAEQAAGYGTATREAAVLMTVRTYKITP